MCFSRICTQNGGGYACHKPVSHGKARKWAIFFAANIIAHIFFAFVQMFSFSLDVTSMKFPS